MGRASDEPLNPAEGQLLQRIMRARAARRRRACSPTAPPSLEEAKLWFRTASRPRLLEIITARPVQSSLIALGLGLILGISPKARAALGDLAGNIIRKKF